MAQRWVQVKPSWLVGNVGVDRLRSPSDTLALVVGATATNKLESELCSENGGAGKNHCSLCPHRYVTVVGCAPYLCFAI